MASRSTSIVPLASMMGGNRKDGDASAGNRMNKEKVIHDVKVVRHGQTLIVPETLPLKDAIEVLKRQIKSEEEIMAVSEVVECFPLEGALALKKAMERTFGYAQNTATLTLFGKKPPQEIALETGIGEKVMVPWGKFRWPLAPQDEDEGMETEWLQTSYTMKEGRAVFQCAGQVKRKYKPNIEALFNLVREIVEKESVYRGKAIRIEFTNEDGEDNPLPSPKFMDVEHVRLDELVYTRELEQLIEVNMMAPIKHAAAFREAQIPLKTGILAAGEYGTGKSLLARSVARVGTEHGWTYLYVKNAAELPQAIRFAKMYQPCIVFAEDLDRATSGERTDEIDKILNTLDGIDTKHHEIMTIVTTNHLDKINDAMLRPGRLDLVLHITKPDAEAASRLIFNYARNMLAENVDLTEVGEILASCNPTQGHPEGTGVSAAVIREVVERSKRATIARTGRVGSVVTADDLRNAALSVKQQQELVKKAPISGPTLEDKLVQVMEKAVDNSATIKGIKQYINS